MTETVIRTGKVIFAEPTLDQATALATRMAGSVVEIIEVRNRVGMRTAEMPCAYLVYPVDQTCALCNQERPDPTEWR